jgi:hypothetical protein
MIPTKQILTDQLAATTWNAAGKTSTACAILLKTLGAMGLADVNNMLTIILTIVGICYTAFRALNEINTWQEDRRKKKTRK